MQGDMAETPNMCQKKKHRIECKNRKKTWERGQTNKISAKRGSKGEDEVVEEKSK